MTYNPASSLRWLGCLLALPFLLTLNGCESFPGSGSGLGSVTNTGPATLHAVQSNHLKQVMGELSGLTFSRLPQELGDSNGNGPDLQAVASVAGSMASSATRIPSAINDISLEPSEREVFLSLARRLGSQSSKLKQQAQQGQMAGVQASMRQISTTCASCHTLFRDAN